MVLKQKSYRDKEHDERKGKRRFRERLVEQEEAEKEIESFINDSWREPHAEKEDRPRAPD